MNDINKNSDEKPLKVFETKWFSIDKIPSGLSGSDPYYRISCGDAVGILVITDDNMVVLIRQFRPAVEKEMIEIPAGAVDNGESPGNAAKRELLEETGFICDSMENIGIIKISPNRINGDFYAFFGKGAKIKEKIKNEPGIEVLLFSKNEFEDLIKEGEIISCETITIYFLAKLKGLI